MQIVSYFDLLQGKHEKGIKLETVSQGKRDRSQELKSIQPLPTNYNENEPLKFMWSLCAYLDSLKNICQRRQKSWNLTSFVEEYKIIGMG